MGLGELWLAGSQQAIDYSWKQHTADLQRRQETREQYKFDAGVAAARAKATFEAGNAQAAAEAWRAGQGGQAAPGAPQQGAQAQPGRVGGAAPMLPQPQAPATTVTTPDNTTVTIAQPPSAPAPTPRQAEPAAAPSPATAPAVNPTIAPGTPAVRDNTQFFNELNAQPAPQTGIIQYRTDPNTGYQVPINPAQPPTSTFDGGPDLGAPAIQSVPDEGRLIYQQGGGPGSGGQVAGSSGELRTSGQAEGLVDMAPVAAVTVEPQVAPLPIAPVPAQASPASVSAASAQLAVQLQGEQNDEQARQAYVRNVYAERMASLSERFASVANLAATGAVTFDIDSFTETYNAMSGVFNQIAMANGQLGAMDAVAIANGWQIKGIDSKGGISYERVDEETGLTYEMGMSRAQATIGAAAFDAAAETGYLPLSFFNQYKEQLMHFPNMFQYQTVDGRPSQNIIVGEQGVLLSPEWHGVFNARLDAGTAAVRQRTAAAQLIDQRQRDLAADRAEASASAKLAAETRQREGQIDSALERFNATELSDANAASIANRYPELGYTAADMQARHHGQVTPQDQIQREKAAELKAKQEWQLRLDAIREQTRDENAAQQQIWRIAAANVRSSRVGVSRGAGGRQTVDATSYHQLNESVAKLAEGFTTYVEYDADGKPKGLSAQAPPFLRANWDNPGIRNALFTWMGRDGGRANMASPTPANAAALNQIVGTLARELPNSVFAGSAPVSTTPAAGGRGASDAPAPAADGSTFNIRSGYNMRSGTSTDASVITTLSAPLRGVRGVREGEWIKITSSGGRTAYIAAEAVE
jgi:hypothetical protein